MYRGNHRTLNLCGDFSLLTSDSYVTKASGDFAIHKSSGTLNNILEV